MFQKFSLIAGSLISILLALTVFIRPASDGSFGAKLDQTGLFDNTAEMALPQTIVADMVKDHFHAPLPGGKTVKKCIVIGLDGARCDTAAESANQAESGLKLLAAQGGLYIARAGGDSLLHTQATKTTSGWTTMLTGTWANEHHVWYNGIIKLTNPKTFLTTLVQDGSAGSSEFFTWWTWHVQKAYSTYRLESLYTRIHGLPVHWNTLAGEDELRAALQAAAAKPDCADILFSIYERPDETGHQFGFSSDVPEYKQAVRDCDKDAYDVIKTIQARDSYTAEDWLILMVTDHGGQDQDHGNLSDDCCFIFIAANKAITMNG